MAVRAIPHEITTVYQDEEKKSARLVNPHKPRRCMVVSAGLLLAGLGIPLFMALGVLPITLLLGFIGFGLAGTGGLMLLIFCGEI